MPLSTEKTAAYAPALRVLALVLVFHVLVRVQEEVSDKNEFSTESFATA